MKPEELVLFKSCQIFLNPKRASLSSAGGPANQTQERSLLELASLKHGIAMGQ